MKKPLKYDENKTIRIVAPASPVKEDFLKRGMKRVKKYFKYFSYNHLIFSKYFFLAGKDDDRAKDLNFAINNFDFVWCARGGYGSLRILDRVSLNRENFPIFLGSSDITSLLIFLTQEYNFITFYGPMIAGEIADKKKKFDLKKLSGILKGELGEGTPLNDKKMVELIGGKLDGIITGGCMTLVLSSLGTPYEIDIDGKILFLEDVNVKPYAIDRMLQQLKKSGKLDGCKGIIFGEMVNCIQNENQGYTIMELLYENLKDLEIPLFFGFPCGHTHSGGTILPIGGRVEVRDGKILLKEKVVC